MEQPGAGTGDAGAVGHDGIGGVAGWPLVTAAEMRAVDRETIEGRGVAGEILMESAGRSLAGAALALRAEGPRPDGPVVALCGAGNNGGDGFVLARHLDALGVPAEVILVGDPTRLPVDAAANWARLATPDVSRSTVDPAEDDVDWAARLAHAGVVVDALFGTGLARPLEGGFARAVEGCVETRRLGTPVLAVDVPSGICADTGAVLGCAVGADRTVTISAPKIGLVLEPGATHAGRIDVARVGIVDPDPTRTPRAELWGAAAAAAHFPARDRAGHKGRFGHVLVVAGSTGKAGAGALSARAATRAGAGLVTLAHPIGVESELASLPVEVMTSPVAATPGGGLSPAGEKAIEELVAARDVVALGPGLGEDPETAALVETLVGTIDRPMVIDADGLNALVGRLDRLAERRAPTVLTPHPGEAGRLLDRSAALVNTDRLEAARTLAARSGAVVVLKGARTVVAAPDGVARVIPTGGPALAAGGTGDVLTGIVAALLAAGLGALDAGTLAAWWHGATADDLPQATPGFGLLASELADALPASAEAIRARAVVVSDAKGGAGDPLVLPFP